MILTGSNTTIDSELIYLMQRRTSPTEPFVNYCLLCLRGEGKIIISESEGKTNYPGLDHYVDKELYQLLVSKAEAAK